MGRIIVLTGIVVLVLAASTHAWGPKPVVVEANEDVEIWLDYNVVSDGEGGVIITWRSDLHGISPAGVQRISRQGEPLGSSSYIVTKRQV